MKTLLAGRAGPSSTSPMRRRLPTPSSRGSLKRKTIVDLLVINSIYRLSIPTDCGIGKRVVRIRVSLALRMEWYRCR